ncbi:MAG: peptidase M15 [Gammaproteobacteria bacterium]|nr:peptidase M15 [Gammaproteobacteria bacterium]
MSKRLFNQLETLGREKLSRSFHMREFLYSETAYAEAIANIPDDPALALAAGRALCENVLEPIQDKLGRLSIRSGYRSSRVNEIGNRNRYNCSSNEKNHAAHIWDRRDSNGFMGATACIVVTSFLPYYQKTGDWTPLAWWIWENVPHCCSQFWFPNLAAVNLRWSENPKAERSIQTYVVNPHTRDKSALVKAGVPTVPGPYQRLYRPYLATLR